MNPWTIIGWSILAYAAYRAFRWCWVAFAAMRDHLRTVNHHLAVVPMVDQRWRIAGEDIEIVKVDDDGIHWKDRYRIGPGGVMSREHWSAAIRGGMRFVR